MRKNLPQAIVLLILCLNLSFDHVFAQAPDLNVDGADHTIGYTGNAQSFKIPEFEDLNNMNRVTFILRGADGGKRKVLGTTKKGGGGAKITATFKVGYGANELRPGAEVRFIVGEEGTSYTGSQVAGAGGGGGTAVLYTNGFNCPPAPPGDNIFICSIAGFIDNVSTSFNQNAQWNILAVAGGGGGAYASGLTDGAGGKSANAEECGDKGNGSDGGQGGCDGKGGKSAINNLSGVDIGDIEISGNSSEVLSGGGGGAFSNGVGNATYDFIGKLGGKDGGAGGAGGVVNRINSNRKYTRVSGGYGYGGGGSGQRIAIGSVFTFAAGGGGGGGYSGGGGGDFDAGGGGGSYVNSVATSSEKEDGNKDGSPNDGKITYQFFRANPVVAVCENQTVILDANGNGQLNAADVLANSYVIDAASASFEAFCFGSETNPCAATRSFGCDDVGTPKWISATVKDEGIGADVCYFYVTVKDIIAPEVTCPSTPVTIGVAAGGTRFFAASGFSPSSTDLCGSNTQFTLSQEEFRCTDAGPNLLTLYATDESGNVDSCTVTLNVNVNNDNSPPVANCRDITVDIGETGSVSYSLAYLAGNSTDNCSIASYGSTKKVCNPLCVDILLADTLIFNCNDVGVNSFEITVKDYNGNSDKCTATVTVLEDTTPPNAVCQDQTVYLDANGEASISLASLAAQSTDNCGIADYFTTFKVCNPLCVDVVISEIIDLDCDDIGLNSYNIRVTDGNGNTSNCTSIITVIDDQVPTTQCEDLIVSIGNNGQVNVPLSSLAGSSFDNCEIMYSTMIEVCDPDCEDVAVTNTLNFSCDELGDYNYDLTVTDQSGNSSNCTVALSVVDDTPPTAICESPTIQLDDNGEAEITLADLTINSSDNCGIASYKSTFKICSPLCVDFTVLERFDFDCDDIGDNTYNIKITDVNGNTSQCTTTITVEDNTPPNLECQDLTIQLDELGTATLNPAALALVSSDNCGGLSLALSQTSFTCDDRGGTIVTLTATDDNNNTSECTAALTIEDNVAPMASCQGATVQLDTNGDGSITVADIDAGSSDACGVLDLSLNTTAFDCSQVGENTVTLTVLDVAGNSSSCDAIVTVVDGVTPLAICQDKTIQLDANGNGSISTTDIDNGSNDACGISALSLSQMAFDCTQVGENTVTLTVIDENDNSSTCTATVLVEDNIAPEANCQDITIQLDAGGTAPLTVADVDAGSSDACGIASLSFEANKVTPALVATCNDVGEVTLVLYVTDINGNQSTCNTTITVEDNIKPTANCQNTTIQLDANGMASIGVDDINNGSIDACDIASLSLSQTTFDCSQVGANNVSLLVTDVNDNSSTCTATVTVEDNVPPMANCQDITIQLDAGGTAPLTVADVDAGFSDACGIASLSFEANVVTPALVATCSDVGEVTLVLYVTDVNGNQSICNTIITVEDNIKPVANCQNTTVQLDANGMASISSADIDNGSIDACGIASLSLDQTSFDCSQVGENTVTLTVVDENSNSASCTAVVTVVDNLPPVIDCFDHTIVFNGEDMIVLDPLDLVESSDNCGVASTDLSVTDIACVEVGNTIPVDISVTDVNGNTSACMVNVSVTGLPCGYSQDPDGVNCNSGSSASYDPASEVFSLTSTSCYFGSPFTNDEEAFIEYEFCGDGEVIAKIDAIAGLAWAGLQFRESMDANSKKFSLASNGSSFSRREVRTQTGAMAFPQQFPAFGKNWIKLVRQGNQFQGYLSNNGSFWQLVMVANIQMVDCIKAGLFMTNLTPNGTVSASFSQVSFNSFANQAKETVLTTAKSLSISSKQFVVFPNPTEGRVTVDLSSYQDQDQNLSLELVNQFGQILQRRTYQGIDDYFDELDLSSHPAGLYFIRLQDENGAEQIERIILQKP